MANLSELLVGEAFNTAREGAKEGIELGLKIEQTQRARQELEVQKRNSELAALNAGVNLLNVGRKLPIKAQQSFFKNVIPKQLEKLGLDFKQDSLNQIAADPETYEKYMVAIQGAVQKLQKGEQPTLIENQAILAAADPVMMSQVIADFRGVGESYLERESKERIQRKKREQDQDQFDETMDFNRQKEIDSQTQSLSKELTKTKGLELAKAYDNINKAFVGAMGKGLEEYTEEELQKDIEVPGIGNFFQQFEPGRARSREAQELRDSTMTMINILLKQRSGAAVTDQEFMRVAAELGLTLTWQEGGGFTALMNIPREGAQYISGMKRLRGLIGTGLSNTLAGYSKEARDVYSQRSKLDLDQYVGQEFGGTAPRGTGRKKAQSQPPRIIKDFAKTYPGMYGKISSTFEIVDGGISAVSMNQAIQRLQNTVKGKTGKKYTAQEANSIVFSVMQEKMRELNQQKGGK